MSDDNVATHTPSQTSPGLVLLVCCGATFMAFLDLSVVNIVFPEILRSFPATGIAMLTWVVSGYAVMFAALLSSGGRLADTVGRKKVFLWSLVGFTVSSLLCGMAPNATWLIVGRFGQGAMAAGMIPAALGLILSATPMERLPKAIGAWAAASGFSAAVGPIVGGLLVEQFDWRSVFVINGPFGLLLLIAGLRVLPKQVPPAGSRLPDLLGTAGLAVGIGSVVAALTEGDRWGWTDIRTSGLLVVGVLLCLAVLWRSRSHVTPAVDTKLWSSRRFAMANAVSAILGISMSAYVLAGALLTTTVWHYSIVEAAGALSVGAAAAMVTSFIAGRMNTTSAQRTTVITGVLLFAIGAALLSTDLFNTTPRFWSVWVPSGLLTGGGLGLAITALSASAAAALPATGFAAGVGMNLTARQVGGAVGIAGLAAIFAARHASAVDALHQVYAACTIVSMIGAIAAFALIERPAETNAATAAAQPHAQTTPT